MYRYICIYTRARAHTHTHTTRTRLGCDANHLVLGILIDPLLLRQRLPPALRDVAVAQLYIHIYMNIDVHIDR